MAQVPTSARIRQRRRQRLLLIALLLLLLLGAAAYLLMQQDAGKPRVPPPPPGAVAVPVARADIRMGSTVSLNRHMRLRYYPPLEVPPDALLKPFQFEQRVALRTIRAGEYLRARDLSEREAPNGFSGLAQPGTRIVVVETTNIKGTSGYLNPGDHVDVLAVGWASSDTRNAMQRSTASVAGGGINPGDPNALGRNRGGAAGASEATLVAEDAVVLVAPRATPPRSGRDTHVVLQMAPGDAHATTLALGAGAGLRFVFRPFNDDRRVVDPPPLEQTTYPVRDARTVEVIAGVERSLQRASLGGGSAVE